jgi:hypothetical protein
MENQEVIEPQIPKIRTVVDFHKGEKVTRTVATEYLIPNVQVGQKFVFDHPSVSQCVNGIVVNIQHVVFLNDAPITYIDVMMGN